jgi:hypothetical protein
MKKIAEANRRERQKKVEELLEMLQRSNVNLLLQHNQHDNMMNVIFKFVYLMDQQYDKYLKQLIDLKKLLNGYVKHNNLSHLFFYKIIRKKNLMKVIIRNH